MDNVLALLAHPDDEALGAGGTLAKRLMWGAEVHMAFFGAGVIGQREASERLWGSVPVMLDTTADQMFDTIAIKSFADFAMSQFEAYAPSIVITHSLTDLNRDHQIAAGATLVACRRARNVRLILGCQGDRHLAPFIPTYFVDITDHWPEKVRMLEVYRKFLLPHPDPRSIMGQAARARYWGTVAGVPMAEAFELIRYVDEGGG